MQLIVTVKRLNKRSSVPSALSEPNIVGTVQQGFRFEGEEVTGVPNPALGKWYKDRDGSFYWGGGLVIEVNKVISNISGLPINLPANFKLGIDISHHNDRPSWNSIQNAGAGFAFIKISEGVGTPDKKARDHAKSAQSNGLRIGYYHFCRPDTRNGGSIASDATAEADEAIKIISGLPAPDLPLVLDLEDTPGWDSPLNKTNYLVWVRTFLAHIKSKSLTDGIIYSRKEYLDRKLPGNHDLGNHKLWLANYSQKDCNQVVCPIGWNDWAIWQFTESGIIGENKKIDLSILKDNSIL